MACPDVVWGSSYADLLERLKRFERHVHYEVNDLIYPPLP
jgi:hypothetical protein